VQTKREIRLRILGLRDALSAEEADDRSVPILERIMKSDLWRSAKTVGLYATTRTEVRTDGLFYDALRNGKKTAFPQVVGDRLSFKVVTDIESLTSGSFGIREPQSGETVLVREMDLILLPGIAFDAVGVRLGYGQGYYDRTLQGHQQGEMRTAGLCYDFQYVERLPREAWDIACDWVFSESKTIAVNGG
jgi:5-formyltetrahydrofolate cyclo-ligase